MSNTAKLSDTDRAPLATAAAPRSMTSKSAKSVAAKSVAARSTAATATAVGATPEKAAEGDVLHFLSRTLQAHFLDAQPQDMVTKLRTLRTALDQQENTLSRWPDSPSKARICAALEKAKNLVTQIADEYGASAVGDAAAN